MPETRYTKSGGVNVAYQVVGDGPLDLVYVPGWVSNVELMWEEPTPEHFLRIRAGVHTGEVEQAGDELRGIAVHVAARIVAAAAPAEVLVSQTVRDLVAGSGLAFEERGERGLKGVPGRWRLHAARP